MMAASTLPTTRKPAAPYPRHGLVSRFKNHTIEVLNVYHQARPVCKRR